MVRIRNMDSYRDIIYRLIPSCDVDMPRRTEESQWGNLGTFLVLFF
jgi:hypothetical protein